MTAIDSPIPLQAGPTDVMRAPAVPTSADVGTLLASLPVAAAHTPPATRAVRVLDAQRAGLTAGLTADALEYWLVSVGAWMSVVGRRGAPDPAGSVYVVPEAALWTGAARRAEHATAA